MSNQVDDSFLKVSRGAPQGVHYKQKYVPFIGKDSEGVAHSFNCTPSRMAGLCLASLEYVVIGALTKIFNTRSKEVATSCMEMFNFPLPSVCYIK